MEKSREEAEKHRINDAWKVLLDNFDRREEIERFLRHFWVARHGDVKSHSLYSTIRGVLTAEFDKGPQRYTAGAFAADLENASLRYVELIHCSTGVEDFDASLAEVKSLSADALHPLLLAASERNDYSDLQGLIEACLSYYVRWTVIGRRESTLLEENIFEAAKEFSGGAGLNSILRRVCSWIPDSEMTDFEKAVIQKTSQARYLLEKIEAALRSEVGVDELELSGPPRVYVDQDYPLHPESELRLEEHEEWTHRLGNLTLLNGRKTRVLQIAHTPRNAVFTRSRSSLSRQRHALREFGTSIPIVGVPRASLNDKRIWLRLR